MSVLQVDPRDNVGIAARDLTRGTVADVADVAIEVRQDIRRGHKVALEPISRGADVIRYGEVVGIALEDISQGDHVHVHNLAGKRLTGDLG